jgi:hypothetical protein
MLEMAWNITVFLIIGCGATFVPILIGNLFIEMFKAPYEKITLIEATETAMFSWIGFSIAFFCVVIMISSYMECTNFWVKYEEMSFYKFLNKLFTFGD